MTVGAKSRTVAVETAGWPNLGDGKPMRWYPATGWTVIVIRFMVACIAEILLLVALLTNLRMLASDAAVLFFYKFFRMGNLHTVTAGTECFLVTHSAGGNVFFRVLAMVAVKPGSPLMA